MGRKIKLTPEVQKTIIQRLSEGNYIETACRAAGITSKTFYNWLEKGGQNEDLPEDNRKFVEFRDAALQALAKAEADLLERMKIIEKGWERVAWQLERRWPDHWAKTERQEITGKGGIPLAIKIIEVNRECQQKQQ